MRTRSLRMFIALLALITAMLTIRVGANPGGIGSARFELVEASITDMLKAIQTGLLTSEDLVRMYLARIDAYDFNGPALNAYLTVSDHSVADARALDAARPKGIERQPLYGIPIALKDNVDTFDMPTTAGSVALAGSVPYDDAFIAKKLRAAGAVVLGKLTLTEFANFLTNGMPGGYSSLGGYGFNPYDPRVAAEWRRAAGPLAGRVELGLRHLGRRQPHRRGHRHRNLGIDPRPERRQRHRRHQADGGPREPRRHHSDHGRSGHGRPDGAHGSRRRDRARRDCRIRSGRQGHGSLPRSRHLLRRLHAVSRRRSALTGARIAVPPFGGSQIVLDAIAVMRSKGAYVEEIPALAGIGVPGILNYGFKRDLNAYLASLPPSAPAHSLADVIARNNVIPGALKYGQTQALASQALDISPDSADTQTYLANYAAGLASSRKILDDVYKGPDGIKGTADDFDALLNPGAGTPARAGYPSVAVPGGFLPPSGDVINPRPSPITFSGPAFSEPRLIALAYAFEQATKHPAAAGQHAAAADGLRRSGRQEVGLRLPQGLRAGPV